MASRLPALEIAAAVRTGTNIDQLSDHATAVGAHGQNLSGLLILVHRRENDLAAVGGPERRKAARDTVDDPAPPIGFCLIHVVAAGAFPERARADRHQNLLARR